LAGDPSLNRTASVHRIVRKEKRDAKHPRILVTCCGYRATNLACDCPNTEIFPPMSTDDTQREQGSAFMPKFDASGLLTAVAVDSADGKVLMVAFMDAEALAATRATGKAHFHSRSRGRLWMKGETSGHVLAVEQILVDCDQDALVLKCRPAGPACHTGAPSCFYRLLDDDRLERVPC
jgi:phosphoribosyl-AMP cyclohydrolase